MGWNWISTTFGLFISLNWHFSWSQERNFDFVAMWECKQLRLELSPWTCFERGSTQTAEAKSEKIKNNSVKLKKLCRLICEEKKSTKEREFCYWVHKVSVRKHQKRYEWNAKLMWERRKFRENSSLSLIFDSTFILYWKE